MKINPHYFGLLLLSVFSGFYITKIGYSPVYIAMALGSLVTLFTLLFDKLRFKLSDLQNINVLIILIALVIYHIIIFDSVVQNAANLIIGPAGLILALLYKNHVTSEEVARVSKFFYWSSISLIIIETAYRLLNPDFSFLVNDEQITTVQEVGFYAYKFNSIMYMDSNFVGLQLVVLLGFILGVNQLTKIFNVIHVILVMSLIVLTLSRASIVTALLMIAYAIFFNGNLKFRVLSFFVLIIISIFFIEFLSNDSSFLSKFDLLDKLWNFLRHSDVTELIFGIGVGNSINKIGVGAHNIVVTYLLELGVLTSILFFYYWFISFKRYPFSRYLFLGLVINGFSLTTFAIPYLYISFALLLIISHNCKTTESQSNLCNLR